MNGRDTQDSVVAIAAQQTNAAVAQRTGTDLNKAAAAAAQRRGAGLINKHRNELKS
tara:strand:+ start:168 stop:335 length:168 start_codon:yes stop_codon:yes gene_type:complete